MTHPDSTANCFVFNDNTLSQAVKDWEVSELKKKPKNTEALPIALVALPWLLKHMNQTGPVYMFTADDLSDELSAWKEEQINVYPHQKQRIEDSCELLIEFFNSDIVRVQHKMVVETQTTD